MNNTYKIYFIIAISLMSSAFISCKKTIDIEPTHTIRGESFFTKIEDYEFALTGAYSILLTPNYYGSSNGANAFVGLPDIMTDNFFESGESLANYQDFHHWTYTADEPYIVNTWLIAYRVILQVNRILMNIDALAANNAGAVNRIKAQALALRAHAHFDALRYWGEEESRNSTLQGIPYISNFDIEQKPARLTVKASYDAIFDDLYKAKDLMQNMDKPIQSATSTNPTARAYIDEMVIHAMLARIYNYAGESDNAIKYASLVIDKRPLASKTNFPLIWQDATTEEVIWSAKFTPLNSGVGNIIYYPIGNRASYRPTDELLSLYDKDNDIRFSSYFQEKASGNNKRLVLVKYLAKQPQLASPDGITDFKVYRTAEMYLIRAEALFKKGNAAEALKNLNTLRAARIKNFVAGTETGNALKEAIFNERRKELVAEGQHWFDLKRTNRTIKRTTNCSAFCELLPTAREWVWPIPQDEIIANENMKQTKGY